MNIGKDEDEQPRFQSMSKTNRSCPFWASSSISLCLVEDVMIPAWIAFSIFSMPVSASFNCFFRSCISKLSCPCSSKSRSISCSINGPSITIAIVSLTTKSSIHFFLTAFLVQPFFRLALPHL